MNSSEIAYHVIAVKNKPRSNLMRTLLQNVPTSKLISAVTPASVDFLPGDFDSERPNFSSPQLSKYEICTKLSHIKSLSSFLDSDCDFLVTFEDDTILTNYSLEKALKHVCDLLTTVSTDQNYIWHLGGMNGLKAEWYFKIRSLISIPLCLFETKFLYRLNAYVTTRKSAKYLLDLFQNHNIVADDWQAISLTTKSSITYCNLFSHPSDLEDSALEASRHGRSNLYLLVCPCFKKGGIEKNAMAYHNTLKSLDLNVLLITNSAGIFTCMRYIRRQSIAKLFIIGFSGSHFCLLLSLYAKLKFIKVFSYFRLNNSPFSFIFERSLKRFFVEIWKLLFYRFFDALIATNSELKRYYRFHNKKLIVIRNPASLSPSPDTFIGNKTTNFKCLFVGRLVHQKNIRNLFIAYKNFFESINDAPFLDVYGDGPMVDCVNNSISLKGWSNVIPYSNYTHIILPSYYEGSPNSLIEGISNGLSIIATPFSCGLSELIPYAPSAVIADNFSSQSLELALYKAYINFRNDDKISLQSLHCYSYNEFKNSLLSQLL